MTRPADEAGQGLPSRRPGRELPGSRARGYHVPKGGRCHAHPGALPEVSAARSLRVRPLGLCGAAGFPGRRAWRRSGGEAQPRLEGRAPERPGARDARERRAEYGERTLDAEEFSGWRKRLGKTQLEMARLLGTSLRAVHAYEQGWRKVPVHVERREKCPAREFRAGDICWFVNGTLCAGKPRKTWTEKMRVCRACSGFRDAFTHPKDPQAARAPRLPRRAGKFRSRGCPA